MIFVFTIHEFLWFSSWQGDSSIPFVWGCRLFLLRYLCLTGFGFFWWGEGMRAAETTSPGRRIVKVKQGPLFMKSIVSPVNIWGCTLFLRSYVYLNESELLLCICVLWNGTYSLLVHLHAATYLRNLPQLIMSFITMKLVASLCGKVPVIQNI